MVSTHFSVSQSCLADSFRSAWFSSLNCTASSRCCFDYYHLLYILVVWLSDYPNGIDWFCFLDDSTSFFDDFVFAPLVTTKCALMMISRGRLDIRPDSTTTIIGNKDSNSDTIPGLSCEGVSCAVSVRSYPCRRGKSRYHSDTTGRLGGCAAAGDGLE